MLNKIIERFEEKNKLYMAMDEGKKIMFTTNKRTAPNSIISKDGLYTIGIEPKDDSYFDREIKELSNIFTQEELIMIEDYTSDNGYEKGKKAYEETFQLANEQYDFQSVLRVITYGE